MRLVAGRTLTVGCIGLEVEPLDIAAFVDPGIALFALVRNLSVADCLACLEPASKWSKKKRCETNSSELNLM